MNQFDLIVVEKVTEEFMSGETKSALEEGSQHHNLVGVGSWDIFILSRPPLENNTGGEKVILEKLEELHQRFRVGTFLGDKQPWQGR
jgi:hypothetical protein